MNDHNNQVQVNRLSKTHDEKKCFQNRKELSKGFDWLNFLQQLPKQLRVELGNSQVLLCHGSHRKVNEFLWESTTSTHFLKSLAQEYRADLIAATHTGIRWTRELGNESRFVNVGALGRPENDGRTAVWYTLLENSPANGLSVEFIPIEYEHMRLASEMREQSLPEEFVETILTGWWTTCLEVLPAKERRRGRY